MCIRVLTNVQPHVISYLYTVQADQPMFAMEYLAGGTLSERMASGAFGLAEAWMTFRQLASALRYVHDQGIIHRDVKPQNILFSENGCRVVLADFGLAIRLDREEDCEDVCGSAHTTAPEVYRMEYSFPADVWSVGVTMMIAFGRITIPRGHLWRMRDVRVQGKSEATRLCNSWLAEVKRRAEQLPDDLSSVKSLLRTQPRDRWSAQELDDHLRTKSSRNQPSEQTSDGNSRDERPSPRIPQTKRTKHVRFKDKSESSKPTSDKVKGSGKRK